ncbi:hypothetical protein [Falsiroseomonas selenitidurans]|uniref:PRTRC system protein E n=1 Tax=Falsiroseomonas selenitidurans TaxID=2716335 RepID=A0ABX1E3D6_9PROT|nr:hypothetical protein [Falsiroseomonas selenitidurans]NKC30282.1 hypothetical protein [Falsiroseomonas selenitidurans]
MSIPTVFGDGVIDVHVVSGVARITLGAQTAAGAKEGKPEPSALLLVPVLQLGNLARVLAEVTRQVEAKAREAQGQAATPSPAHGQVLQAQQPQPEAPADQVSGAFRFNG